MSSSSPSSSLRCCWTAPAAAAAAPIDCVCLGTGRFLRAVLVPALSQSGFRTALVQPRGRTLLDSVLLLQADDAAQADDASDGAKTYPVDTVLATGEVETAHVPMYGAFSLGAAEDRKALFEWLGAYRFSNDNSSGGGMPRVLGVGVTEAGLSGPETSAMKDLYEILRCLCTACRTSTAADSSSLLKMSVINTDNVPFNGDVLRSHMLHIARYRNDDTMVRFLSDRVYFHNSMVDRITSHRPDDPLVPRAEPMPAKALVILDPLQLLAPLGGVAGVVLRRSMQELQNDLELKLRVANGTHTALAHVLAILGLTMTNHVVNFPATDSVASGDQPSDAEAPPLQLIVQYLDSLVEGAVVPAWVSAAASGNPAKTRGAERERAVRDAWDDWRRRLWHPSFGLSSYFITQNGPAKGGIRLGPTVRDLLMLTAEGATSSSPSKIPVAVAYAFAALLRWLTPRQADSSAGVYRGWLQPSRLLLSRTAFAEAASSLDVEYADGLRYNLGEGWYEFRCACTVVPRSSENGDPPLILSDWLATLTQQPQQPLAYGDAIRSYLLAAEGGHLADVAAKRPIEMDTLVRATATLYARMVAGDDLLELLDEMKAKKGVYTEGMESSCSALVDEVSIDSGRPLHYRE
jgi:hypothetical protein